MMQSVADSKKLVPVSRAAVRSVLSTFNGIVGGRNRSDDFTLTVTRRGIFSASLTGLQANASLQLQMNNGRVIARSNRPGRQAEVIRRTLEPGQYFVRVSRNGSRTQYTLTIADESSPAPPATSPSPSPAPAPSPAPTNPPPAPVNPFQNLWGNYQGVGTTTIGLIDPFSRQIASVDSFQTRIVATVAPPRSSGGITEQNPFNLSVGSSREELFANALGAIQINSALPFNFRDGFLLQSWSLQYSGNQLSGTLTNTDSGTALSTNLFNSVQNLGLGLNIPFPYQMAAGTRLQGTLTPTELRIRIEGADTGQTRVFISDIIAQRVA